jgi:hypothetical protein
LFFLVEAVDAEMRSVVVNLSALVGVVIALAPLVFIEMTAAVEQLFTGGLQGPVHPLWRLSMRVVGCNLVLLAAVTHPQFKLLEGVVVSSVLYHAGKCVDAHNGDLGACAYGLASSVPVFALALAEVQFRVSSGAPRRVRGLVRCGHILWILLAVVSLLFAILEIFPTLLWRYNVWPARSHPPPLEQVPWMWLATLQAAGALRVLANVVLLF